MASTGDSLFRLLTVAPSAFSPILSFLTFPFLFVGQWIIANLYLTGFSPTSPAKIIYLAN